MYLYDESPCHIKIFPSFKKKKKLGLAVKGKLRLTYLMWDDIEIS